MTQTIPRRRLLTETGMGLTGIALSSMLFRDGVAVASEEGLSPHHTPKAKSVIWIFLIGGLSHLESFDPKPALDKYGGKSIDETPFAESVLNKDKINENLLDPSKQKREVYKKLLPLQIGFKKCGQGGMEISDWFPHLQRRADDLCLVRGMWTIDNNHGAQLTYHTGRKISEGAYPTVGSWVSYGLGTANRNLPEFVVLGNPSADCCGAAWTHGSSYLGPKHAGVRLKVDAKNPLSFVRSADEQLTPDEQRKNFGLLGQLNRLAGLEYPDDQQLQARIKSYELAFEMQTSVPQVMNMQQETSATQRMYGIDQPQVQSVWREVPCSAAARRERSPVHSAVPWLFRQCRRVGLAQGHQKESLAALPTNRPTDRWTDRRFEAARNARRDAGRCRQRVRPHARARVPWQ